MNKDLKFVTNKQKAKAKPKLPNRKLRKMPATQVFEPSMIHDDSGRASDYGFMVDIECDQSMTDKRDCIPVPINRIEVVNVGPPLSESLEKLDKEIHDYHNYGKYYGDRYPCDHRLGEYGFEANEESPRSILSAIRYSNDKLSNYNYNHNHNYLILSATVSIINFVSGAVKFCSDMVPDIGLFGGSDNQRKGKHMGVFGENIDIYDGEFN